MNLNIINPLKTKLTRIVFKDAARTAHLALNTIPLNKKENQLIL